MSNNMLGKLSLSDFQGPRDDFETKLAGEQGERWFSEFKRFLRKEPTWQDFILFIDRSKPFDPGTFIGAGWKKRNQDRYSLSMREIDFCKVSFETCLKKGEVWITGKEKLERHEKAKHILADAKIGQTLLEEEGQKTLEYLYNKRGIAWFELLGTVLLGPDNCSYNLCLYRKSGCWCWRHIRLSEDRGNVAPSLVLAS